MKALLVCLFGVLFFYGHGAQSQSCLRRVYIPYSYFPRQYANSLGGRLEYSCHHNNAIVGVHSIHDNGAEDRKFKFACSAISASKTGEQLLSHCTWSGYSELHEHIAYSCPPNKFLAGWKSTFNKDNNDRQMSFKCCTISGIVIRHCKTSSDYENPADEQFSYHAPKNSVVTGVETKFFPTKGDRRYKFTACEPKLRF